VQKSAAAAMAIAGTCMGTLWMKDVRVQRARKEMQNVNAAPFENGLRGRVRIMRETRDMQER
jgi:hypothetical protein